jgi:hypothetical protein
MESNPRKFKVFFSLFSTVMNGFPQGCLAVGLTGAAGDGGGRKSRKEAGIATN